MKKKLSVLFLLTSYLLLNSSILNAKLLDKTAAVIDDKVITLSDTKRLKSHIAALKQISPMLYAKKNLSSTKSISELIIKKHLIKNKLSELGYIIPDEDVEARIKATEKRAGFSRQDLMTFLSQNNVSFKEYFEVIRETIEYSYFIGMIIRPLISITDQEVKNYFYKQNINNKAISFKYNLIDFHIEKSLITKKQKNRFTSILRKFQKTGDLPDVYSELETSVLGDITEDGLTSDIKNILKQTDEGKFTRPILLNKRFHVFFIKKKEVVESSYFLRSKNKIKAALTENSIQKMLKNWINTEVKKHYVKYFTK